LDKDLSINDLLELTQDFYNEWIFSENITKSIIENIDQLQSRLCEITEQMEKQVKERIADSLRFYLVYKKRK
jgi:hypothetical protein